MENKPFGNKGVTKNLDLTQVISVYRELYENQNLVMPIVLHIDKESDFKGGAQFSLLTLITAQQNSRYQPIVCLPKPGVLSEALSKVGGKVVFLPPLAYRMISPFNLLKTIWLLRRICIVEKIRLIHVSQPVVTFVAGIVAALLRIPMIWHIRVGENDPLLDFINIRLATKIIAITHYAAKRVPESTRNKKVLVVSNAILSDFLKPFKGHREVILKKLGIDPAKKIVTKIAQIIPWKNHSKFVEVAKILNAKGKNIQFIIVGKSLNRAYEDTLRQSIEKYRLQECITFLDFYSPIAEIIHLSDVIVHCAQAETFGRVIIEAMACTKPVVAFDSGGIAEIIDHNITGFLVPFGDVSAMAQAVQEILSSPALSWRMGRAGREKVERCFTVHQQIQEIEKMYDDLLPGGAKN